MGDVDDSHAAALHPFDQMEQTFRLMRRQRRGRFVQNQDTALAGQGARDLNKLLLSDAQPFHLDRRVDVQLDIAQQGSGANSQIPMADRRRQVAEEEVLRNAQTGNQRQFLKDHDDAARTGLGHARQGHRFAGDRHGAAVAPLDTGYHLHQRRLAGAVLPHQRVNLSLVQSEVDALEGLKGAETLGDAPHLQKRHQALRSARKASISARFGIAG